MAWSEDEARAFLEAVRRRPGMFIGDTRDGSGLANLVWEVVANALDQFLAGACTRIDVTLTAEGAIRVSDDGSGIPVHLVDGVPFAQRVLTEHHATPTADGHRPHEHLTPHGMGLAVVNALSEWLVLETCRAGRWHTQRHARGQPLGGLALLDTAPQDAARGTRMSFLPDAVIFSDGRLDGDAIARRLRELAWLHPPLKLTLTDHRTQHFHAPGGLEEVFLQREGVSLSAPLLRVDGVAGMVHVQVLAQWTDGLRGAQVDSYANVDRTTADGEHVDGFFQAIVDVLRERYPQACRGRPARLLRQRMSPGLQAVVRVRLKDPAYGAPTRSRLASPEARQAVRELVRPALHAFIASHAECQGLIERRLG